MRMCAIDPRSFEDSRDDFTKRIGDIGLLKGAS
jgi:hypothetical protein